MVEGGARVRARGREWDNQGAECGARSSGAIPIRSSPSSPSSDAQSLPFAPPGPAAGRRRRRAEEGAGKIRPGVDSRKAAQPAKLKGTARSRLKLPHPSPLHAGGPRPQLQQGGPWDIQANLLHPNQSEKRDSYICQLQNCAHPPERPRDPIPQTIPQLPNQRLTPLYILARPH